MATPNTFIEDLAPYASMIIPETGSQIGSLLYANTQDLVSTAALVTTNGIVGANQKLEFYLAAQNEVGQGFTTGATLGQTNSLFSRGQAPKNQVYVATHCGFEIFALSGVNPSVPLTELLIDINMVFSAGVNFSWDLTIGRGNVRTIGQLLDFPGSSGAWASVGDDLQTSTGIAAQNGLPGGMSRKLRVPICFPPLINVQLTATNGNAFQLFAVSDSNPTLGVRAFLKGALMTLPQG